MNASFLRHALRRALLVSLAVPASSTAGCGGNVVVDPERTGTATGTGGSSSSVGSTGSGGSHGVCALLSTAPISSSGTCSSTFALVGPASDCSPGPYGMVADAQCVALCPPNANKMPAVSCWANDVDGGGAELACTYIEPCGTGRRPAGLAVTSDAGPVEMGPVARYLSDVAHLEAASVVAFEQLAGELEAHGAPRRLVVAARRAGREEARHARVTRRFAERAGGRARPVEVSAAERPLEAIAIENAVEGCVRETFGAVLAMRQAVRARSGALRRSMSRIAREEASHAHLSWELASWLAGKLDAGARSRVEAAQRRAVEALACEARREPDPRVVAELGVPTAAEARAAIDALRATIWAPVARAA